jgi:hypothetical protein
MLDTQLARCREHLSQFRRRRLPSLRRFRRLVSRPELNPEVSPCEIWSGQGGTGTGPPPPPPPVLSLFPSLPHPTNSSYLPSYTCFSGWENGQSLENFPKSSNTSEMVDNRIRKHCHFFGAHLAENTVCDRCRDRVVSLATRYGLEGPRIEFRWETTFSSRVQTGRGAHPASWAMGTASFSWGYSCTSTPLLGVLGLCKGYIYLYLRGRDSVNETRVLGICKVHGVGIAQ